MIAKRFAGIGIVVGLLTLWKTALASSDAGIDLHLKNVDVLVTYSVALDYEGADYCIRNPECLLFDIITVLQNSELKTSSDEILQFDLYQSSNKEGNWLSLVKNPFEGGAPFKELYDGKAKSDLSDQIRELLEKELTSSPMVKKIEAVTLFRCINKRTCNEIRFGSFPSEDEHTGFCMSAGEGCANKPIVVRREEMTKYFSQLSE